jgi:hypothetical protein
MSDTNDIHVTPTHWISRHRIGLWFLGLAVLSAIAFGPLGLPAYLAGFLKSYLLFLFFVFAVLVAWGALFLTGCIQVVRAVRTRQKPVVLWSSIVLGIALAFTLGVTGKTPRRMGFGQGLMRRLEIRTDIEAIQAWVESLDPNEILADPHWRSRGTHLSREKQPSVLQRQDGMVDLELDTEGRPRVRLTWFQGKAGKWGLVISHKDVKTPPSDWSMYGERRDELRPGVYFWYVES